MGWVNNKGAKAIKKFDDGGKVDYSDKPKKLVHKERNKTKSGKTKYDVIYEVDIGDGDTRLYHGEAKSGSKSTAEFKAKSLAKLKMHDSPADSLSRADVKNIFDRKISKKLKKKSKE
tara:strand:- start:687 stop:1037 length:351 start_codon:yes stop_codon:yes gene_type:complete